MGAIAWRTMLWCGALAVTLGVTPARGQSFAEIDAAVRDGIRKGIYPGAVVVIGRRDSAALCPRLRALHLEPLLAGADPDSTLWDVASITKVVSTTSSAMRLVDQGKLDLDAPVRRYLPRFSGGLKNQVTVRMLLDHTSGLKSYVPFYLKARGSRAPRRSTCSTPSRCVRAPGDSAEYSDLNALFLGLMLEKVVGLPLDQLAKREVFDPLGLTQTDVPASALGSSGASCRAGSGAASRCRAT